jgi:hypothetical protein
MDVPTAPTGDIYLFCPMLRLTLARDNPSYARPIRGRHMVKTRQLWEAALVVLVLAAFTGLASATSVEFTGLGNGGTWSWDGSGPLQLSNQDVQIQTLGANAFPSALSSLSDESVMTGVFTGGSGTVSDPWTFAPSPAGSITITGCEPPDTACPSPVTLFSGEFDGTQSLISADDGMLLEAPNVSGTVDPGLMSYLGLFSDSVSGMLSFSLTGNLPGDVTGAGDLIVSDPPPSPTPEPAAMVLMGTGLLAVGIVLRLKGFGAKG